MQKINSATGLRDAILQLESRQAEEGKMLKAQFYLAYDSLKPINLIKSTFKATAASRDLKENILNTAVGLAAGYLSKLLFEGVANSPIKKLLGSALMLGITNIVAKNPDTVKSLGKKFLNITRGKLGTRVNGVDNNETR
jgi:hypothetical protein